ncbi:MAG: hypothetical protein ACLPQI_12460 [Steroidobacteraceae bacterium]
MRFSLPQDTNVRFVAGISELSMTGLGRSETDAPSETRRSAQKILGPRHGSPVDPEQAVANESFRLQQSQRLLSIQLTLMLAPPISVSRQNRRTPALLNREIEIHTAMTERLRMIG